MRKLLTVFLLLCLSCPFIVYAFHDTIITDGPWSNPLIFSSGKIPRQNDTVYCLDVWNDTLDIDDTVAGYISFASCTGNHIRTGHKLTILQGPYADTGIGYRDFGVALFIRCGHQVISFPGGNTGWPTSKQYGGGDNPYGVIYVPSCSLVISGNRDTLNIGYTYWLMKYGHISFPRCTTTITGFCRWWEPIFDSGYTDWENGGFVSYKSTNAYWINGWKWHTFGKENSCCGAGYHISTTDSGPIYDTLDKALNSSNNIEAYDEASTNPGSLMTFMGNINCFQLQNYLNSHVQSGSEFECDSVTADDIWAGCNYSAGHQNYGHAVYTFGRYVMLDNSIPDTLNFGTATLNASINFVNTISFNSACVPIPCTAKWNILETYDISKTYGKPYFYDLNINVPAGGIAHLTGSVTIPDSLILTKGTWINDSVINTNHLRIVTTDSIFINDTIYCQDSSGASNKIKFGTLGAIVLPVIYTQVWTPVGSSTNANDGNNYTPAAPLWSGDTIIIDNSSANQWKPTADIPVKKILIRSTYTSSINLNGFTTPSIINYKPGLHIYGTGVINMLYFGTPGTSMYFQSENTVTLISLLGSNWSGIPGHIDSVLTITANDPVTINISAGIRNVHDMYFKDIHISGEIINADSTCIDGGNNINIIFPSHPNPYTSVTKHLLFKQY